MSSSDSFRPRGEPLRVGYVLKRFPRLSETFILNEMLALERAGIELTVFSLKRPLDEIRNELLERLRAKIIYLPEVVDYVPRTIENTGWSALMEHLVPGKSEGERSALLTKGHAIATLALHLRLQHLHAHFASDATTAALVAARQSGVGFSFTAHARDIFHCYVSPDVDDEARRLKIAAARFVVTVSEYNRRHLLGVAGARAPIVTLYNGIDLSRFEFTADADREPGRILAVGRLVEKKGFDDLIEACRLLRERGFSYQCDIVGGGEKESDLSHQIERAGVGKSVRLLGALSPEAVVQHMKRASVMVLPCKVSQSGDRDGLPTVLLESLAVGLPAVSTSVAGIPEIIEHGRSGLLVEPSRPAAITDAVSKLFCDRALRATIAAAGRTRAERLFDLTENAGRLRRYFAQVTEAKATQKGDSDAHRLSVG